MKRLLPILAIAMTIPAFADIDQYSLCDNNTLGTYDGSANLRVNWIANTINLDWYNDDNLHQQNTCTYGQNVTLPNTTPTKPGYNFVGWQLRLLPFDLSILANATPESPRLTKAYKNLDGASGDDNFWCTNDGTTEACSNSIFSHLNNNEWSISFGVNGTVKGEALCSSLGGSFGTTGNPQGVGNYPYCWCRATGYTNSNNDVYRAVISSPWVLQTDDSSSMGFVPYTDPCELGCVIQCANTISSNADFRRAVFGVTE